MVLRAVVVVMVMLGIARAQPMAERPLTIDDGAGVLTADVKAVLADKLVRIRDRVEIGIVTVRSTGPERIEDFARRRAGQWHAGTSPAALIVLAIDDRKSRIEVTQALRDRLTDARAVGLLDAQRPALRAGNYGTAITRVALEIAVIAEEPAPWQPAPVAAAPVDDGWPAWAIFLLIVGLVVALGTLVGYLGKGRARAPGAAQPGWFDHAVWGTGKVMLAPFMLFGIGWSSRSSNEDTTMWSHGAIHHDTSSSHDSSSSSSSDTSSDSGWSGGGGSSDW